MGWDRMGWDLASGKVRDRGSNVCEMESILVSIRYRIRFYRSNPW